MATMLHVTKGFLSVETVVPCAVPIDGWLRIAGIRLDRLIAPSREFERAYLAWETVRKARNPYFEEGTGFEGYFVGMVCSPEQMLESLLELGRELLLANFRLYRFNPDFRGRLMQALIGERLDYETICVWSDLLGATLGRLRCNLYTRPQASVFQVETYRMTSSLQPIRYWRCQQGLRQAYELPFYLADRNRKLELNLKLLKPSDYDAGLVVDTIGRFGHPLVREYLREYRLPFLSASSDGACPEAA